MQQREKPREAPGLQAFFFFFAIKVKKVFEREINTGAEKADQNRSVQVSLEARTSLRDTAQKPGQTMPEFTLALAFYSILKTSTAGRRLDLISSYLCVFIFIYDNRYSAQTSGFSGYARLSVPGSLHYLYIHHEEEGV